MSATPAAPRPSLLRRVVRALRKPLLWVLIAAATVYLVRAIDSRSMPDLELWHTVRLDAEFRAADGAAAFSDYLAAEERLFAELDRDVYDAFQASAQDYFCRYDAGGPSDPRGPGNWNRTFELEPEEPRGGALLVHGLTDSPYSLRRVGEILRDAGYYVLGLRLPGHGTTPGSLADVAWRDWSAAVRLAALHVEERIGEAAPFVLVGYSAGGALAVLHAASVVLEGGARVPDRLILFSPAIGVGPLATVASWHRALSWMPFFAKFRWSSIEPEYDPFKYNSFPKNGGEQMFRLAGAVQERLAELARAGRTAELPAMLAYQSLVDATVLTGAVVGLFEKLAENGSELVLFDINRAASLRPFVGPLERTDLERLQQEAARAYRLTVVTNVSEETAAVAATAFAPHSSAGETTALGESWPAGVYSLSHVALPFPPDDPIYGAEPSSAGGLHLGTVQPRGERGLLRVSVNQLMRLRYNPFFEFVEARLPAE